MIQNLVCKVSNANVILPSKVNNKDTYCVKSIDNIISEVSSGRLVRNRIWLGGCSGTVMPPAPCTGGGWLKRFGRGGTTVAPGLTERKYNYVNLREFPKLKIIQSDEISAPNSHSPFGWPRFQQLSGL